MIVRIGMASASKGKSRWRRRRAEQRSTQRGREHIVGIKVHLSHHADVAATLAIDRYDRLDTNLKIVSDPDHAGLDRAGSHEAVAEIVADGCRELYLDDRDEVVNEVGQAEIDDAAL